MKLALLSLLLIVGCYTAQRVPGQCLIDGDSIVRVSHMRGLTMVYLQAWDTTKERWAGTYPADLWALIGWDGISCPVEAANDQ